MHELSIAQSLCHELERCVREHGAQQVRSAVLEVGVLSNVVPELLRHAFDVLRETEVVLQRAELSIRTVPLEIECTECGQRTRPDGFVIQCAHCSSTRVHVVSGEELLLRDVELEMEEDDSHDGDPSHQSAGEPSQVQ